jgi:hypothetical protein
MDVPKRQAWTWSDPLVHPPPPPGKPFNNPTLRMQFSLLLKGAGHYATSRKVAGSTRGEVNELFQFT